VPQLRQRQWLWSARPGCRKHADCDVTAARSTVTACGFRRPPPIQFELRFPSRANVASRSNDKSATGDAFAPVKYYAAKLRPRPHPAESAMAAFGDSQVSRTLGLARQQGLKSRSDAADSSCAKPNRGNCSAPAPSSSSRSCTRQSARWRSMSFCRIDHCREFRCKFRARFSFRHGRRFRPPGACEPCHWTARQVKLSTKFLAQCCSFRTAGRLTLRLARHLAPPKSDMGITYRGARSSQHQAIAMEARRSDRARGKT